MISVWFYPFLLFVSFKMIKNPAVYIRGLERLSYYFDDACTTSDKSICFVTVYSY
ncbi:protein of unknown function [Paenibacillus alvei]|uniref:Uncharacterized protein n=1 Tax=Paenibacillus alvei TaxID=44250 RepID=A0A383RAC1_PAEAL|nr:protein of unknown function [Paenibacillus alvei]